MGHLVLVDLRRVLSAGIERSVAALIRLGGAELGMFHVPARPAT